MLCLCSCLAGLGLVGLLHWWAGVEVAFSIFYVLPIAAGLWFCGRSFGLILSVLAAAVWLVLDVSSGHRYSNDMVPYWNAAVRLGFFTLVTLLLDRIRFLTTHLESSVRERTASLLVEIESRRQAEEGLREREERFRQVVEHIREVFWMTDPEKSRILYVSPAYEEIWGRRCASLLASPQEWMEAIHLDDQDRVRTAALTRQVSGEYHETYRIVRPDGSIRWIEDRAFPILDDAQKVYRIVGIAEDITERKRVAARNVAFSKLGQELSSARTPREAALIIVAVADELMGWDACYLHLCPPETQQNVPILTFDTIKGSRVEIPAAGFTPDLSSWMKDLVERGSRLVNRDRAAFAPVQSIALTPFGDESRPSASMMYALIRRGQEITGILSIQSYTFHAYDDQDLVLLQSMADFCAAALVRIQMEATMRENQQANERLAAEVLAVSDRERRLLGYDLHDGLGQLLSGIALKAKVVEENLKAESSPHAPAIAQLVGLINQANSRARDLARGADPIEAEAGELTIALRHLAADSEKIFSGACRVLAPDSVAAVNPAVSTQLYRICQEAISNAFRHGGATSVEIELTVASTGLGLTIRDDGGGFDPARMTNRGMGLQIMSYRARSIGGTVDFRSGAGHGTQICCEVPNARWRAGNRPLW